MQFTKFTRTVFGIPLFKFDFTDREITLKILEFVINSIEKVKTKKPIGNKIVLRYKFRA